jgi:ACS family glucarate transporter-like MFS transporter
MLYLTRFAISPVATNMMSDMSISKTDFGWVQSAFFWAYALFQIPAGWLTDKFGVRKMLPIYIILWSMATIAMGFAGSLMSLILFRVLLGISQAGAYPSAAAGLRQSVPVEHRAKANAATSMGGRLGGVVSNLLTPWLAVLLAGTAVAANTMNWRSVLMIYGALGILWGLKFVFFFRNSIESSSETKTESKSIQKDETEADSQTVEKVDDNNPYASPGSTDHLEGEESELYSEQEPIKNRSAMEIVKAVATSPTIYILCLVNILINIGWVFLATWLPDFLNELHRTELEEFYPDYEVLSGALTAVVLLFGVMGNMTGGVISDILLRKLGKKWGRRLPGMIAGAAGALLYALSSTQMDNVWVFVGIMCMISFFSDLKIAALWATYQDIGGKNTAAIL